MIETIFSGVLFIFSLIYLFAARDLRIGTLTSPGVGFLPLVAGSGAAILSFVFFISGLMKKLNKKDFKIELKKLGLFMIGLIIYVAILKTIGYAIATFVLMLYLLKVCGTKGWILPVGIAVIVSVGMYYVFAKLLMVPLP